MDFDLRRFSADDAKWKRSTLYLLIIIAVGLGAESVSLVVYRLPTLRTGAIATAGGQSFVFVMVGEFCAVGIALVCLPRFFSGARQVTVDDSGIHLIYDRQRSDHYRWDDPLLSFGLEDYSEYPDLAATWVAYGISGPHLWNRRSILTKEAFGAILEAASERGLAVSSAKSTAPWYWRDHMVHQIRHKRQVS